MTWHHSYLTGEVEPGGGIPLGSHRLSVETRVGNLGLSDSKVCSFHPCSSAFCEVNVIVFIWGGGREAGEALFSHTWCFLPCDRSDLG